MKRTTALATLAALAVSLPLGARAQSDDYTPPPTPVPDPHTYNDDAMSMVVPREYNLVYRGAAVSPDNLADKPTAVAVWGVLKPVEYVIQIAMVAYQGDLAGYDAQYSAELRDQEGLMIHNSSHVSLKNGMPAIWKMIGYGSEFHMVREFALIWADTLRAVVVSFKGSLDDTPESTAKLALSNISAVKYPQR